VPTVPDVLVATDSDSVFAEVEAALGTIDQTVLRAHSGREALSMVEASVPALVVLDLQIGNMGGMATCLALRNESGAGRLPRIPIVMLLDRSPDVFLARRSDADGWLIKPLDAFRLRKCANAVLAGEPFQEGVPADAVAPLT
jgi:DNA-binding response OmpR family regulator